MQDFVSKDTFMPQNEKYIRRGRKSNGGKHITQRIYALESTFKKSGKD